MAKPGDLVQGIFSLVVSFVVFVLLLTALQGGDISGIANMFVNIMPGFVILLVLLFFVLKIAEAA